MHELAAVGWVRDDSVGCAVMVERKRVLAGAVAMFLELEQAFGGLVRISPEPMRQAVKTLEAEPSNQNAP